MSYVVNFINNDDQCNNDNVQNAVSIFYMLIMTLTPRTIIIIKTWDYIKYNLLK